MEELDDEGDHDDSETMMQRLRLRTRVSKTISKLLLPRPAFS